MQTLAAVVEVETETQHLAATKTMRSIPRELYLAFQHSQIDPPSSGHFASDILICGLMFSTFSKHRGNACILIKIADDAAIPAEITHVSSDPHPRTKVYVTSFASKSFNSYHLFCHMYRCQ